MIDLNILRKGAMALDVRKGIVGANAFSKSARTLDIRIPGGGDLVTVSEAFFDESYQDKGPRILCVAGYVFRKSHSIEFRKKWSAYLKRKGLPYFHANECAHKTRNFKGRTDSDEVSRKLISLTKKYSDFGVAVAVNRDQYEAICTDHKMFPSVYAFVLTNCLYQIAHWRIYNQRTEPTAFYFEQGHQHQNDADKFLSFMLRDDDLARRIGYRSHAFVPKDTPQVQSADLLAWLWRLHAVRKSSNDPKPDRKDLIELNRPSDQFITFERDALERFRDSVLASTPEVNTIVQAMALIYGLTQKETERVLAWQPDYRTTPF